jgi:hypothetical protein
MERIITIKVDNHVLKAKLNESRTANKIWESLPMKAIADMWGKEIYFEIPLELSPEKDASEIVERGDIAYWPPGKAFCIFWGPTPASKDNEIRAASPVNVFGKIIGNPNVLDDAKSLEVTVEKLSRGET